MFKKKSTYLKVCVLMIIVLLAISAYTLAASISNVTGLKADMAGSSAYLAWNPVSDASGYDVYFNISNTGYKKLGTVVGNGAKVSGFVSGSTYQSRVIAYKYVNGSKIYSSSYSNEITIMIPTLENDKPSDAKNLRVTMNGSQAKLTWDKSDNASGYDVYFNIPNSGYTNIGSVDTNSANVSGFTEGYTYYAKVLAYKNSNGKKVYANNYSNEISVRIDKQVDYSKPSNATNLTAKVNNNYVALNWDKSYNATGYDIYLYTPGYGYRKLTSVTNNYYDISKSSLDTNKTYYVKVLAYRYVNGNTIYANNYSNEANFRIEYIDYSKPNNATNLTAKVNNNYVALDWDKSYNATGYDIYLYTPGYGYRKLTSVTNNYYDISKSSLDTNKTYYVKVLAYRVVNGNTIYANNYSNEANFRIEYIDYSKPGNATNLTAKINSNYVALDWDKSYNATGYDIYLYTPGYGYRKLTSVTNNYYDIAKNSLDTNKTYYVKVLAYRKVNGNTIYANNYSNEANFRIEYTDYSKPSAAYNLKVYKINNNKVELTWNGPSNASGYELYVYTPGQGYSKVGDYKTTRTYLQNFTPGYTYYAKVLTYRTVNGNRIYANNYSNEVSITMSNNNNNNNNNTSTNGNYNSYIGTVTGLKASVTGTSAKLSWNIYNTVKGYEPDGYEIRMVIPGYGRTTFISTTKSYTITGLTTYNESYTTQVCAYKYINGEKVYGTPSNAISIYRK